MNPWPARSDPELTPDFCKDSVPQRQAIGGQEIARAETDWILFLVVLGMVGFGLVLGYSASSIEAARFRGLPVYWFVVRQSPWALLGLGAMMHLKGRDYRRLNSPAWAFSALGIVLTLVLTVWIFDSVTHRWFRVPGILSFDPSEFAKPAMILFMAYFLARRKQRINDVSTLVQVFVAVSMMVVVVIRAHVWTALVPALTALIVLWVAGLERRYVAWAAMISLSLPVIGVISNGYRLGRVINFFDPQYVLIDKIDTHQVIRAYVQSSPEELNYSYHSHQSRIAVGAGGIMGMGLMQGSKLTFLPDAAGEFIYGTVGEEFGLLGSSAVLVGYTLILWRGARVFLLARDDFGRYLALGVTISIVLQALLSIDAVLDIVPNTGLLLPMMSLAGTSLLSTLVSLGILLSVAEH